MTLEDFEKLVDATGAKCRCEPDEPLGDCAYCRVLNAFDARDKELAEANESSRAFYVGELAAARLNRRVVRYQLVMPTNEQAAQCRASLLYQEGDAVLAWVNEGDIIEYGKVIDAALAQGDTREGTT